MSAFLGRAQKDELKLKKLYSEKEIFRSGMDLAPHTSIAECLKCAIEKLPDSNLEFDGNFDLEGKLRVSLSMNEKSNTSYPVGSSILLKDCVSKIIGLLIKDRLKNILKENKSSENIQLKINCYCKHHSIEISFWDTLKPNDQIHEILNSREWRYVQQYLKIVGGELDLCSIPDGSGFYVSLILAAD